MLKCILSGPMLAATSILQRSEMVNLTEQAFAYIFKQLS